MYFPVDNLTVVVYNKSMKSSSKLRDVRKIRYTDLQLKELIVSWERYIEENDFPTKSGFISLPEIRHKFKLTSPYIADHPELFSLLMDAMQAKCEDYLVKQGLAGRAMPMTIFLLKQLQYGGYSDQQQLDLRSQGQPIKFVNLVPRPKK